MRQNCIIQTPLGEMIALVEQDSLSELCFAGQKNAPEDTGDWRLNPDHPVFTVLREQLDSYFAGQLQTFDLPLATCGTEFQTQCWTLLRSIPFGKTVTYGELARQLAEQRQGRIPAAQAVGGAVGRNPIEIIIPCHRVVGADRTLTGYAGGLERKAALLKLEKAGFNHPVKSDKRKLP